MYLFSIRGSFYFLVLFVLVIAACDNFKTRRQSLEVLPQDPAIQVYFNHNPTSTYEDPYRHFRRQGDNLEKQIIDAIEKANSTVDVAVMELRLPKIAEELKRARSRGIKVRILIDNKYNKTLNEYTQEEISQMNRHDRKAYEQLKQYPVDALALLRQSQIEIKDDTSNGATKGSGLMHHKFLVVDGKTTIISSGNFTMSDLHGDFGNLESRGNPNNIVVIPDNANFAKIFTEEFNYMWRGLFKSHKPKRNPVTIPVGGGTVTVKFSPARPREDIATTSNGIIASYIQKAKKSVHVAVFVFSDQKISDTLGNLHAKGVKDIKLLIDPDFIAQNYSKAYDALGVCPRLGKKNRLFKVNPWKNPIATVGFPVAAAGDRGVHSKMAILDGMLVIAGSHNWSNSGNYFNDETLIFIDNPGVAAHYEREFHRLYKTAQLGLVTLPHARKCEEKLWSQPLASDKVVMEESEFLSSF